MPQCQHCDSHVSERFCRVFLPEHMDHPKRCLRCDSRNRIENGAAVSEPDDYAKDPLMPIEGDSDRQADILLVGRRGVDS